MCRCSQATSASNWQQEWQEFWAAAAVQLEQLGYSSYETALLKGLLLQLKLPICREYFEGSDQEVKLAINALLMPVRKCSVRPRSAAVLTQDLNERVGPLLAPGKERWTQLQGPGGCG